MDGSAADSRPGRTCPLAYRYPAAVFNRAPDVSADTLYVVGGLYGNGKALQALLAMAAAEASPPTIVFNGDFNWFNRDAAGFAAINNVVLQHTALRGNVETELASEDDAAGCGCAYPDDVSDADVERSNAMLRELRAVSKQHANIRNRLAALPMHAVAQVADLRIGIVHGDAESLAGWGFAHDQLDAAPQRAWLKRIFAESGMRLFTSSHTCLPALRRFEFGAVINNGAAGMPNFRGDHAGLITRIGRTPAPHATRYGCMLQGVHVDALPLEYDQAGWLAEFLANWPEGSSGHQSYYRRITAGPGFTPAQARGATTA